MIAIVAAVGAAGGYDDFQWIGKDVGPLGALGILGPMLLPVAALFYARSKYFEAMAKVSQSWPAVRGTVMRSKMIERAARGGPVHRLDIAFSYQVDGNAYESSTLAFAPKFWSDKGAVQLLATKYPPGAAVDVHYDPSDPQTAVLETTPDYAWQRTFVIWVLLAVPFIAALLSLFRQ